MLILHALGGTSLLCLLMSIFIILFKTKQSQSSSIVNSFIGLIRQTILLFNRRLLMILFQFIAVSNLMYIVLSVVFNAPIYFDLLLAFNVGVLIFSAVVFGMCQWSCSLILPIVNHPHQSLKSVVKSIVAAGASQILFFYGCLFGVIYGLLLCMNWLALLAVSIGIVVVAYYYRLAGGAFKIASEFGNSHHLESENLTHPSRVIVNSGRMVAGFFGYYLDIFSSLLIAIAGVFAYVEITVSPASLIAFLNHPIIKWTLLNGCFLGMAIILACGVAMIRQQLNNIYVELVYFIVGLTLAFNLALFQWHGFSDFSTLWPSLIFMFIVMIVISFYSHYLTSLQFKPVQFIASQAQFGISSLLTTAMMSALLGNGGLVLFLLVILVLLFKLLSVGGLMVVLTSAVIIAVVICSVRVIYELSYQVETVFSLEGSSITQTFASPLSQISDTLKTIGNAFSTVAGLLASIALFIPVLIIGEFDPRSLDFIFGFGLGVVVLIFFYAFVIMGTDFASKKTKKEIDRQLVDIPLITQRHKSHPNINRLSDQCSVYAFSAVTFSGTWIILSLFSIERLLSIDGMVGCMIGVFVVVFIQSFFWSLFGDSVASVYDLFKRGRFGGEKTSVFSHVEQSYFYSLYFQWLLAPTGVIIIKLIGLIVYLLILF